MALQLKLDPTGFEAAAARARGALDDIKGAAVGAESAIDKMGKSAGPMFGPINREGAQAKATFDSLRQSIDPAFAASVRYKNAVLDIDTALRMQVISQREASDAMAILDRQHVGLDRASKNSINTTRMLGQQLSQVAQQGAVTGNYLGALAVQLPDMALGFGSVAIAASIVATVAMPLLITAFGYGKTGAEGMADANDRLADSLGALRDMSKELSNLDELREKYGQVDTALLTLIGHQRDQALASAQTAARDAIRALASEYGVTKQAADLFYRTGRGDAAAVADSLGMSKDQLVGYADALSDAQNATTFKEQAEAMARVDGYLSRSTISSDELGVSVTQSALDMRAVDKAAFDSAASITGAKDNATGLTTETDNAWDAMLGLVGAAPSGGWLSGAISDAAALAATLWDGARAAQMARLGDVAPLGGPAGMGSSPPTGGAVLRSPRPGMRSINSPTLDAPPTIDLAGAYGLFAATQGISPATTGGGGGGAAGAADKTREAYDRLMASLDPVVAKTQDMAEATATANAALAAHDITAAEHANALDLIAQKYGQTSNAMADMQEVGGNAIDSLINGTMSLSEALRQMAKDLIFATIKAQLLNSVTGGESGDSIGGLLMKGIIGGFSLPMMDGGGSIPRGGMAMVGERGPELVRATSGGAVVTSRTDTARMIQGGQNVHVSVGVTVDDEGKMQAYVKRIGQAAAQSGAAQAVQTVRRTFGQMSNDLQRDGALA